MPGHESFIIVCFFYRPGFLPGLFLWVNIQFLPFKVMKYTTFDTLTVRQYQQLFAIHSDKTTEDIDKIIQSVCVLTGLSERGVEQLSVPEFNKISAEIAKIFSKEIKGEPKTFIQILGKRHGINYQPSTLSTGQYVEIQTWMRTNVIENLHTIFASIVYEVKGKGIFKKRLKYNSDNHPVISEAILDCNFIDVHSSCVFFLKLWNDSIKALEPYLEKELKAKGLNSMKIQEALKSIMDGSIMPNGLQTLKT